jgi:hypothetical protein
LVFTTNCLPIDIRTWGVFKKTLDKSPPPPPPPLSERQPTSGCCKESYVQYSYLENFVKIFSYNEILSELINWSVRSRMLLSRYLKTLVLVVYCKRGFGKRVMKFCIRTLRPRNCRRN